jgi:outer membrane protein assembly factor BamB
VWGYGRTLFAIDVATKKVLWRHQEAEPMDSRALCMKNGRLFALSFGSSLTCLDAKTGRALWRKTKENATDLFDAIGAPLKRQDWRTNWRTTAYMRCSDKAVYFAGPQIGKLLAISAEDGRYLWHHPYDNYQVILRGDTLYGIPGSIDQDPARKFDALTGQVLAEIKVGRRACTRPTASRDAIFFRAGEGSARLDLAKDQPQMISPMRAQCHDGVTIANGLLYWWPSTCDCNLSLLGITCLGPAGGHEFGKPAVESERLERGPAFDRIQHPTSEIQNPGDWPVFRANNTGTVTTPATVAKKSRAAWKFQPNAATTPTAPTTAGGRVFLGGHDGIVRALDAANGRPLWTAYTGGAIRFPPTLWEGRAFVASGDGWAYSFEAKTGRLLWRFRAAPVERRIPIYGQLLSTWPAASGVLVENGVAFVAAGLTDYDGTHVFALDAATGRIKWQNSTSGILDPDMRAGVAVQGHMLIHDGKLHLAGGNAASPGIYDLATGKCLNDPAPLRVTQRNNMVGARAPRGWELFLVGNNVMVSGKPFYAHPQYPVYDSTVVNKTLVTPAADRDLLWVNNAKVMCLPQIKESRNERLMQAWGKPAVAGLKPLWEHPCKDSLAFALCQNAALVATATELTALDLQDGRVLWTQPLAAPPVPWGLAVARDGRVIATLEGGGVVCFSR